jgi:hypothetical protein
LLGDFRGVEAGFGEEAFGVIDGVDAGGFEVDTGEAGGSELGFVVRFFEGAGDAADPEFDVAFMTQLEMMTSMELSGRGMCSISPLRNSTFWTPAFC